MPQNVNDSTNRLRLALLERLHSRASEFNPHDEFYADEDAIEASICRNVAWILGTRRPVGVAEGHPLVSASIHSYGLTELSAKDSSSEQSKAALAFEIQNAIANYEPRLADVRVYLNRTAKQRLNCTIAGRLASGSRSLLSFPATINLTTQTCTLAEER